jgi:hypothetical protein
MQAENQREPASKTQPSEYESPRVESVMDAEELAREVHYAGGVIDPISPV